MNELHANDITDNNFVPEEGQRDLACSNKKSVRCPSSGFNPNEVSEDEALEYLASILVEAFLDKKADEYNKLHKPQKSGDICPGINQRTG